MQRAMQHEYSATDELYRMLEERAAACQLHTFTCGGFICLKYGKVFVKTSWIYIDPWQLSRTMLRNLRSKNVHAGGLLAALPSTVRRFLESRDKCSRDKVSKRPACVRLHAMQA